MSTRHARYMIGRSISTSRQRGDEAMRSAKWSLAIVPGASPQRRRAERDLISRDMLGGMLGVGWRERRLLLEKWLMSL